MAEEQKKVPIRPMPKLTELDTAEFWHATKNKEFKYQQCANCQTIVWHPRRTLYWVCRRRLAVADLQRAKAPFIPLAW